ncbi:hypothetical protein OH76DRAFT_569917 [Lentinus brumalis]|uniref:Uncharacterized protein n=1 Tax=Lentinus brumalis TaxID=2498619 RepID=A0A371DTD5_9APHY|nr:hypothetical protein OH76DRAFT_569917 [Polyporus brumalis]
MVKDGAANDEEATADDGVAAAVDDAESGAAGGARPNVTLEDTPEDMALEATDDVAANELCAPPVVDDGKLEALSDSDSDDTDRLTLVPAGASQLSRPCAMECRRATPNGQPPRYALCGTERRRTRTRCKQKRVVEGGQMDWPRQLAVCPACKYVRQAIRLQSATPSSPVPCRMYMEERGASRTSCHDGSATAATSTDGQRPSERGSKLQIALWRILLPL